MSGEWSVVRASRYSPLTISFRIDDKFKYKSHLIN